MLEKPPQIGLRPRRVFGQRVIEKPPAGILVFHGVSGTQVRPILGKNNDSGSLARAGFREHLPGDLGLNARRRDLRNRGDSKPDDRQENPQRTKNEPEQDSPLKNLIGKRLS